MYNKSKLLAHMGLKGLIRLFSKKENKPALIATGNIKPENKQITLVIEEHPDGWIAYPLGIQGVIVGEGDTRQEALEDAISSIQFHIESFGPGVIDDADYPVLTASVERAYVPIHV